MGLIFTKKTPTCLRKMFICMYAHHDRHDDPDHVRNRDGVDARAASKAICGCLQLSVETRRKV